MLPTCQLCKINTADKKNSHIISKSIINRQLINYSDPDPKNRNAREIDNSKEKPIQDSPKTDHLFCSNCESRLGVVEGIVVPKYKEILDHEANCDKLNFRKVTLDGQIVESFVHKNLPNNLFRAFLFTLLWRVSISDEMVFKKLKLNHHFEEAIRVYLNSILKISPNEFLKALPPKDNLPFRFCLSKRKNSNDSRMPLAVSGENIYLVGTILNFGYCFNLNSELLKSIPIFLVDNNDWDNYKFYIK